MRATIRWVAWYEHTDLELSFPDGWEVHECPPVDGPDLTASEVAAAVIAAPAAGISCGTIQLSA